MVEKYQYFFANKHRHVDIASAAHALTKKISRYIVIYQYFDISIL